MMILLSVLNLLAGLQVWRLLGRLYIGTDELSLNEQMIEEGYAEAMTEEPNKKTLKNSVKFVEHMEH